MEVICMLQPATEEDRASFFNKIIPLYTFSSKYQVLDLQKCIISNIYDRVRADEPGKTGWEVEHLREIWQHTHSRSFWVEEFNDRLVSPPGHFPTLLIIPSASNIVQIGHCGFRCPFQHHFVTESIAPNAC